MGVAVMGFRTHLEMREVGEIKGRSIYLLLLPLIYEDEMGARIVVPAGFQTDLASVPRLPVVYLAWGDRAHREAVLHDYAYRIDAEPKLSFMRANTLFLEAMCSNGVKDSIRWPMFLAVCACGYSSYNKLNINYQFVETAEDIF